MSDEPKKRSKGIDAPRCKVCGQQHWGTCANQGGGGYLYRQLQEAPNVDPSPAKVKALKAAVAKAAEVKPKKAKRRGKVR